MAQPIQAEQLQEVVSCEADSVAGQQYRDCSMYYVYLIQSINTPEQKYIGFTENLKQRIHEHNAFMSAHTKKFAPWKLVTYIAFSDKKAALDFETYLKKGSGHAFANKRLWSSTSHL